MGLTSFLKEAGEKLFGKSADIHEAEKAQAIRDHLIKFRFDMENQDIRVDGDTVTIRGKVKSSLERKRVIAAAGNVEGISNVNDLIQVADAMPQAEPVPDKEFYTVQPGDTLSVISGKVYGDTQKYDAIFEANRPMLSNPDKIYPGQVLVIPY